MVEDDELVVEAEIKIGEFTVVFGSVWEVFDVPNHIVSCVADGATDEGGQVGYWGDGSFSHGIREIFEWIIAIEGVRRFGSGMGDLVAISDDTITGADCDEGVSTNFLSADDAFEESCGIGSGVEQSEGADGGQVIAEQTAIDRNDFELMIEFEELIEVRKSIHSGSNWSRVLGFRGC